MSKSKSVETVLAMFKEKDVKFVDLRFTDPRGKMQHVTMDVNMMGRKKSLCQTHCAPSFSSNTG